MLCDGQLLLWRLVRNEGWSKREIRQTLMCCCGESCNMKMKDMKEKESKP
jgi:hypothetical protein